MLKVSTEEETYVKSTCSDDTIECDNKVCVINLSDLHSIN